MECIKCKRNPVSNSWFKLCRTCNRVRLEGDKLNKSTKYISKENKPLKSPSNDFNRIKHIVDKGNQKNKISHKVSSGEGKLTAKQKDELLYERVFNNSNHKCENCNTSLPKEFRNSDGKVEARYRYSHIIPKSIAPELRHEDKNINNLCLKCHQDWEYGNKTEMNIFKENYSRYPSYFKSGN
jgi:hypothetical protein